MIQICRISRPVYSGTQKYSLVLFPPTRIALLRSKSVRIALLRSNSAVLALLRSNVLFLRNRARQRVYTRITLHPFPAVRTTYRITPLTGLVCLNI